MDRHRPRLAPRRSAPLVLPTRVRAALLGLPLAFLGVFFAWPTASLLWRGLTGTGGSSESVLAAARTWRAVETTFVLATAGTAVSVLLGIPAAWALFRIRWRGQPFARALVTVPFVLPTVVVGAAFSALVRRGGLLGFLGLDQSSVAIVAALAFFNVSVVIRLVGGTWSGLDPDTALAARTLGASRWTAFRRITLPALGPAIAAAAAVVFLFCASSFGVVLVLGGTRVNTIETEIWQQVNTFLDLRAASCLAILQLIAVAAALGAAAWIRSRSERSLGRRRSRGSRAAARGDALPAIAALAPVAALLALPVAALVQRSLRTRDGWGLDHYGALLGGGVIPGTSATLGEATVNSLVAATLAATVAVVLGLALAAALAANRRASWIDSAVLLPVGVSSVVVGLGMLLTLRHPLPWGLDLGRPALLIPAAQAVVALPIVVRSLLPPLRAIGPGLRAAAATLGASPAQTLRHVDWPLVRRPIGLSAGLAFAICLGEFGATAFVARPDYPTLPTTIVRLLGRPGIDNAGLAFAASVVLACVTGAIMLATERWRSEGEAIL